MNQQPSPQGPANMYGYASDTVSISNLSFGGIFGQTRMTKFEWINNGGKGGTAGEALDIVFNIAGTDKSYRLFPVTKAFDNQVEITDPNHPRMAEERQNLSKIITHILKCFQPEQNIAAAFSVQIGSFQQYAQIARSLLPQGFEQAPLDIFMQWQWKPTGENTQTFLEIPTKMKYGYFLSRAVAPVGKWNEVREENTLKYVDDAGNQHPFVRGKWFMESTYANQQKGNAGTSGGAAAWGQQPQPQGGMGGAPLPQAAPGWGAPPQPAQQPAQQFPPQAQPTQQPQPGYPQPVAPQQFPQQPVNQPIQQPQYPQQAPVQPQQPMQQPVQPQQPAQAQGQPYPQPQQPVQPTQPQQPQQPGQGGGYQAGQTGW